MRVLGLLIVLACAAFTSPFGCRSNDGSDARQQAADLNVTFNQYGQHDQADRREVSPPIEVESAT